MVPQPSAGSSPHHTAEDHLLSSPHCCLLTPDQIEHRLWSFCSAQLWWACKTAALVGAIMNIHSSPHLTFSNQLPRLSIQCPSLLIIYFWNVFISVLKDVGRILGENGWINLFVPICWPCNCSVLEEIEPRPAGLNITKTKNTAQKNNHKTKQKSTAQISTNRAEIERQL